MSDILQSKSIGTPATLEAIEANFTEEMMAIDVQATHEDLPTPAELVIQECGDAEMLRSWFPVAMRGFDATEEGTASYYNNYVKLGFGEGKPWHHYVGWLHNEPVGVATLLLHAGVAGIYGVAVLPEARRQGVGAAMTLHALREARALGYQIALLMPSKMGIGIYCRIGFQAYGSIHHYTWSPSIDKQEQR